MIVYLCCYIASYFCSLNGFHFAAGILCILSAIYLYYYDYRRTKNLVHLRGLFSLFWLSGQGLSCFKLSYLQTTWNTITWVCFFLALMCFWLSFEILDRKYQKGMSTERTLPVIKGHLLLEMIVFLTVISMSAFLLEAVVLGYIPFLIKGVPHAYSEFHITGVHYFTVSCVLVPGLTVLYLLMEETRKTRPRILAMIMCFISLLIPVLCVSRFQLLFSVLVAAATYIVLKSNIKLKYVMGLFMIMIPLYLLLTVARSHDVTYLNGIFEMRNKHMPIFITQPYMYIANNYDNFNCLVESLPAHTYGIRMLFPVWALTGLKFIIPQVVSFPLYTNKEELTTLTMFYDSYYDFGMLGVGIFACLLGIVAYYLTKNLKNFRNPVSYLIYAQIAIYMVLSFFTTWFSNPTTWFYLAMTGFVWIYYHREGRIIKRLK